METKEAIKLCKCILNWPNSTIRTTEENIGGLREVISLLQQGEAYRQMWEEFKMYESGSISKSPTIMDDDPTIKQNMEEWEQKYLKEAKHDETDNK